jgi:hypothetical protein
VQKDRDSDRFEVEEGVTSGDYLQGFLRGTRTALYENDRDSMTISIGELNAFSVGMLIALYERAVGFMPRSSGLMLTISRASRRGRRRRRDPRTAASPNEKLARGTRPDRRGTRGRCR